MALQGDILARKPLSPRSGALRRVVAIQAAFARLAFSSLLLSTAGGDCLWATGRFFLFQHRQISSHEDYALCRRKRAKLGKGADQRFKRDLFIPQKFSVGASEDRGEFGGNDKSAAYLVRDGSDYFADGAQPKRCGKILDRRRRRGVWRRSFSQGASDSFWFALAGVGVRPARSAGANIAQWSVRLFVR